MLTGKPSVCCKTFSAFEDLAWRNDVNTDNKKCWPQTRSLGDSTITRLEFYLFTLEYRINGGGKNNRGGWKWFDITIIGGVGIIGGVLGEIENSPFLR